jgi:hypothetical protein
MSGGPSESSNVMVFVDAGYLRKYANEKYGTDEINYRKLADFLSNHVVSGPTILTGILD